MNSEQLCRMIELMGARERIAYDRPFQALKRGGVLCAFGYSAGVPEEKRRNVSTRHRQDD